MTAEIASQHVFAASVHWMGSALAMPDVHRVLPDHNFPLRPSRRILLVEVNRRSALTRRQAATWKSGFKPWLQDNNDDIWSI